MAHTLMNKTEFAALKRDDMVAELRAFDAAHDTEYAKGMSRAKKDKLVARHQEASKHFGPKHGVALGDPGEPKFPMAAEAAEEAGIETEVVEVNKNTETGRFSSEEPNEGGTPQADPLGEKVLLRQESQVYFFVKPGTGDPKRPLTSKESWYLNQIDQLRKKVGPTYIGPEGRRSNPTKHMKKDLGDKLYKLSRIHGIVVVSDEAVKNLATQPAEAP